MPSVVSKHQTIAKWLYGDVCYSNRNTTDSFLLMSWFWQMVLFMYYYFQRFPHNTRCVHSISERAYTTKAMLKAMSS